MPESTVATREFVVPRSMPTILLIIELRVEVFRRRHSIKIFRIVACSAGHTFVKLKTNGREMNYHELCPKWAAPFPGNNLL
jgi:hypothetical protein